ncbi:MAG: hypothetical protein SGBAC_003670 [Bacillariaceae sp.]
MTNKLPPPSVWIKSKRCIFGASVFDGILSSSNLSDVTLGDSSSVNPLPSNPLHYDRALISLKQDYDGQLRLFPEPFSKVSATQAATEANKISQGSASKNGFRKRFVQLAVVGLVVSPQNEILITQRPSYMRSFPGAWVFPGGSVDAADESLEAAIAREVKEETGLHVKSTPSFDTAANGVISGGWTIEGIWESVFPTIPQPEVPIKRHHLVVYLSIKLSEDEMTQTSLKLCDEEVDAAVWLSPENVDSILSKSSSQCNDTDYVEEEIWVDLLTSSNSEVAIKTGVKEPLRHLSGIYPRFDDDSSAELPFGMAQGSLFALQEYSRRHRFSKM